MPRYGKVFKKRKGGFNYKKTTPKTSPNPSTSKSEPKPSAPVSRSTEKIKKFLGEYNAKSSDLEYTVIDLSEFAKHLEEVGACRLCQHNLSIEKKIISGLACTIKIFCLACSAKTEMVNCKKITVPQEGNKRKALYDLNIRLVYGFRTIGKGQTAAKIVCGILNVPPPPVRYNFHETFIGKVVKKICHASMTTAVNETVTKTGSNYLCVAVDGSWQRRGHSSLNGVVSITSVETGKVIDISIMSKYCTCPERNNNIHLDNCKANFQGSSGAMEVTGVLEMFRRSVQLYDVYYTDYLGDGDSSAYKSVSEAMPYGPDLLITKQECVGHVMKRMGTRLRKLREQKVKLADGKTIAGKNRLTKPAIQKIQEYYGLAIRRNTRSVDSMQRSIWAEYLHLSSSNENKMHYFCPANDDTWCKFNAAKLKGEEYNHKDHFHLPKIVMQQLKPIFRDLSDKKLLARCLMGKTQNPNESLNNVIWSVIPKRTFVGLNTLRLGVYDAVLKYNDGHFPKTLVMEEIGLDPGHYFLKILKSLDQERIRKAEKAFFYLNKKLRQKWSLAKKNLEEQFEAAEDPDNPSYSAGNY